MDERSPGLRENLTSERTLALGSFGSIPGSREPYHKLFDEVFTWQVCSLSHMRVNARVCAGTGPTCLLLARFAPP